MRTTKLFTRLTSLVLSFIILFTLFAPQSARAEAKTINGVQIETIEDNDQYIILKGTKNGASLTLKQDKQTLNISLQGDRSLFKNDAQTLASRQQTSSDITDYQVVINEIGNNNEIDATFTDLTTKQEISTVHNSTGEVTPQVVFLVPLGVVVGEALLAALLASAIAVTIGGIVWTTVGSIKEKIRNQQYDHYMAKVMQGDVYIGNPISLTQASNRLAGISPLDNNVWSKNSASAKQVARLAGGGIEPIGPELQVEQQPNIFYYVHYHTWNRAGGHSFF
ncbi:hypothetical protein [Paenibacillus kandeliae]|uniref:hypothetical protein n=1 Tax=Paenibacillus kandeliae TaxID=3231269 RepID=UPI003459F523